MNYYLIVLTISLLLPLIFYVALKMKTRNCRVTVVASGLSKERQEFYIEQAQKSRKVNSPVLEMDFNDILSEGEKLLKKEHFTLNDSIIEGSGYHVL